MEMILAPRLSLVAALVPEGARVADIGTDHAYVPIRLCQSGKAKTALAADIKEGPLLIAQKNIARYGLADQIKTRLSDGLAVISQGEADCVIVAGMGGETIISILDAAARQQKRFSRYILQPMSMDHKLRQYLYQSGFSIQAERLVRDSGKLYTVLCVSHGRMDVPAPVFYEIGEKLIEAKDPWLTELLAQKLASTQRALAALRLAKEQDRQRISEFEQKVKAFEDLREGIEKW